MEAFVFCKHPCVLITLASIVRGILAWYDIALQVGIKSAMSWSREGPSEKIC